MNDKSPNISTHEIQGTGPQILYARMRWLNHLRWVYAGLFAVIEIVYLILDMRNAQYPSLRNSLTDAQGALHPMLRLAIAVALYALVSSLLLWGLGRKHRFGWLPFLLRVQLVFDLIGIVGVIHFTGGFVNPLILLLLFQMGVSASLLGVIESYGLAGFASFAYIGMILYELITGRPGSGFLGDATTSLLGLPPLSLDQLVSYFCGSLQPGAYPILVTAGLFGTTYFVSALLARLRRINHRLVEANRHLEGLDLAKSRFLRVSAHQLRSPMAAIHTMLSAVQEAGGLNHQQYEIVRKIQSKSEDAMTLVDEMMLLSTIKESAAEVRQLQRVDVDQIVRDEVEQFAAEAASKNMQLTAQARCGSAVQAWEDALETVLEHLVSNAIKYTPDGGSVNVQTRRNGQDVELVVSDSGIGIPAGQRERLFHEFFRATNARQVAGGTGMGLAIVHAIVERLSGKISIESAEDKGTTVTVTLPAASSPGCLEREEAPQPDKATTPEDPGASLNANLKCEIPTEILRMAR